ncbi:MAG: hypothetical protein O2954_14570 [bacterium]|nr:hypothetical protein [bacterium]
MISTHKGHLRIVFCITLLFLCLVSVHPTSAFDGAKSGFVLSVGPGAGWVYNDFTGGTEKKIALKTNFQIGYGLSSGQTLVTWTSKVLWFDSAGITTSSSTGGLGITRFLGDETKPTFLSVVIGFNQVTAPFESNSGTSTGFGLGLGIGKEISKNWLIGFDITWGEPESNVTTYGLGVYFSHLWY